MQVKLTATLFSMSGTRAAMRGCALTICGHRKVVSSTISTTWAFRPVHDIVVATHRRPQALCAGNIRFEGKATLRHGERVLQRGHPELLAAKHGAAPVGQRRRTATTLFRKASRWSTVGGHEETRRESEAQPHSSFLSAAQHGAQHAGSGLALALLGSAPCKALLQVVQPAICRDQGVNLLILYTCSNVAKLGTRAPWLQIIFLLCSALVDR